MAAELTYTIVGRNQASKAFKDAADDASRLGVKVKSTSGALVHFAGSAARKVEMAAKAVAVGLAAVTVAAGTVAFKLGKESVKAASDLNETMSKSDRIFGKNAAEMRKWSTTSAKAFGLSQEAALGGAAQFGNFFSQIHIGGKQSANMSKQLVKLSADLGSFSNADPAEVMNSFQSATRGEYDALQKFIPTISAATVQAEALRFSHKKNKANLTDADKATALYRLSIKGAGKATGDFKNTAAGLANQQRSMKAGFTDLKGTIGQALLPAMIRIASTINNVAIPAFKAMALKHGPALKKMALEIADKINYLIPVGIALAETYGPKIADAFGKLIGKGKELGTSLKGASAGDVGKKFADIATSVKDLGPVITEAKNAMPTFNDALKVGGTVLAFMAHHVETLKKLMPYLAAAYVVHKVAQMASNVAAAISIPLRVAEAIATSKHASAMRANTAAMTTNTMASRTGIVTTGASTAATNAGALAQVRAKVATIARTTWDKVAIATTAVWAGVQWLLAGAINACIWPVIAIIAAIALFVGIVVLAYKKNETFRKIVDACFKAIGKAAMWLWNHAIKPNFALILAAGKIAFHGLKLLWDKVLKPVFVAVGATVMWLWNNAIKPAWERIKGGWSLLLIGIRAIWNNVLKPTFNAIGTAVGWVKEKFHYAIEGIKVIWGKLKAYAQIPIKFVIDNVINKGLIGSWNWIDEKVLGKKFHINPFKFATGGIMPGYSPGKDNALIAVGGGEAIMRPEWTRAVGPKQIHQWNAQARRGGKIEGFADGGIFDGVKSLGAKVWETAKSTVKGVAEFLANPAASIKKMLSGALGGLQKFSNTGIGRVISAVPRELITKVTDAAKGFAFGSDPRGGGSWTGAISPGIIGAMQKFALAQQGKRYLWSAVGPGSYDCSGLAGNFYAMAGGLPQYRRYFLANNPSMSSTPGMTRGAGKDLTFYIGGQPGSGHITTHIGGMNAEAYGGNGTPLAIGRTGTPLSYFHTQWHLPGFAGGGMVNPNILKSKNPLDGMASWRKRGWPEPYLYDKGGWLAPGTSLVHNGTGKAERVLAPGQSDTDTITAPVVLKLDSEVVYRGLLKFRRRLGGTWELGA